MRNIGIWFLYFNSIHNEEKYEELLKKSGFKKKIK